MRSDLWISVLAAAVSLAVGFILLKYPNAIRDYYFKIFKEGAERTGFFREKIESYPGPWSFRLFGFIFLTFGVLIVVTIWRRLNA